MFKNIPKFPYKINFNYRILVSIQYKLYLLNIFQKIIFKKNKYLNKKILFYKKIIFMK